MFIDHLRPSEILAFLKTCKGYKYASKVELIGPLKIRGYLLFSVEFSKEPEPTVSRIVTVTDTEIFYKKDESWIKYLYSLFGANYKLWYKKKQEEEFERLFAKEQK